MSVRLHHPGAYATATVGRVYLIRYLIPTTVDYERRILADFAVHREAVGRDSINLALVEHPILPLPTVDVRAFWRSSMDEDPGVEAFAVIAGGFVGLWAAALTNLLEHLIEPARGIRFRIFSTTTAALDWVGELDPGASAAEINATVDALRALS